MTRIEPTSTPSSQTALAKRSTSTSVLPVPAPAETKTLPRASIAACCSEFGCLGTLHPAHRPELAPGRALAALRVVLDVAAADAPDETPRELLRTLDLAPERLLVEVVGAREAGHAVVLCLGAEQPTRGALAGERAVDPTERLDPDEVAQDDHVERDLQ